MKTTKIVYWTTTIIVALMMTYSTYAYLTKAAAEQGFQHLGYPGYFRVELAMAKLTGAILLLAPIAGRIKEWAYAGFFFTFISAFIAHTASGDPLVYRLNPIIILAILMVSYFTYHRLHKEEEKAFVQHA
jgi:DoxX-like family